VNMMPIYIKDNVIVEVFDVQSDAVLPVERITAHNVIVNDGRNVIRDLLAEPDSDGRSSPLNNVWFAWGSDNTAADVTDTALGSISSTGLQAITEANTAINYQVDYKYFLSSGTGNATSPTDNNIIKEAGLFYANVVGDNEMFAHVILDPIITKTSSLAITFTWTVTITAG